MVKYRVYPSLLDEFSRYQKGSISLDNMLNRINRVRDFDEDTYKRMQRGIRFEKAVLNNQGEEFGLDVIQKVRDLLPYEYATQYALNFVYQGFQVYGFADIVGEKRVIDIKTTASYRPEKYLNSFQNLYLYALRQKGAETMEYIVYDFKEVHHLVFSETNFQPLLDVVILFGEFLEKHRHLITDKRIFVEPKNGLLF